MNFYIFFAAGSDELIESVVNGIPKEAKRRGVYSEDALRERFLKVDIIIHTSLTLNNTYIIYNPHIFFCNRSNA